MIKDLRCTHCGKIIDTVIIKNDFIEIETNDGNNYGFCELCILKIHIRKAKSKQ